MTVYGTYTYVKGTYVYVVLMPNILTSSCINDFPRYNDILDFSFHARRAKLHPSEGDETALSVM